MSLPIGKWPINSNGFEGTLNIKSIDTKGVLTGTVQKESYMAGWLQSP